MRIKKKRLKSKEYKIYIIKSERKFDNKKSI